MKHFSILHFKFKVAPATLFIFFLFSIFYFLPASAEAEYIETFNTTVDLASDASFSVTETIGYVFTEEKHGIIREIPLIHPETASASWKERIIDIELGEVRMDNAAVPYVLESTDDRFILRIGDADKTITGQHTYTFTYRVEGGLSYPKGQGTELYWNVTGNEWTVPIHAVETTITSTDGLFRAERSCYRGAQGDSSGSCQTKVDEGGRVTFRATDLFPGEGMTIAQALDTTRIPKEIRERVKVLLFAIPLTILMLIYGIYRLYRYKTAYKTDAPIIAQYEPYPDMKPMYTGFLMDGKLDPSDITACIVYLAEQGYLRIRKVEKKVLFLFDVDDYEIELLKLPDETIGAFESRIFGLMFKEPLLQNAKVTLGDLKHDRAEQQENYREFVALQSDLSNDLKIAGLSEGLNMKFVWVILVGLGISILCISMPIVAVMRWLGFVLMVSLILALAIASQRKTLLGYEVIDYLKGFKLFLETTEKDRYLFHNAPEKSPEQFMQYLPYAIAFGVEEKWAKVFEGITIPNPGWYDSGSVSAFSATNLATSLGAFSTAFASSGASASSGGGSSGGGAGGGGGGSW